MYDMSRKVFDNTGIMLELENLHKATANVRILYIFSTMERGPVLFNIVTNLTLCF